MATPKFPAGGLIRATPKVPTLTDATGVWQLENAQQSRGSNIWPLTHQTLYKIIQELGLTSGLQAVYDPADLDCYTGSGQNYTDAVNAYDFYLGNSSSAEATDPTFNGTAGTKVAGTYFSGDGGDYFRAQAQPSWVNSWHKDSAIFTFFGAINRPALGAQHAFFGTNGGTTARTGVMLLANTDNTALASVTKSVGGTPTKNYSSTATFGTGWQFGGWGMDEAAGAGGAYVFINNTVETYDPTYSSPAAGDATDTLEMGALGNAAVPMANTMRVGPMAFWSGVKVSSANMSLIYTELLKRFT